MITSRITAHMIGGGGEGGVQEKLQRTFLPECLITHLLQVCFIARLGGHIRLVFFQA